MSTLEQEQTQREVEELKQRFHGLLEATRDAISITERGSFVEVNRRFEVMFGVTREELAGRTPLEFVAPEYREMLSHNMRSGYDEPYEVVCLRKDGSSFPAEIYGKSIAYQGNPARVAMIRDLTERQRAEEARRTTLVQQEVIRAQEAILAELSTPLLPISDDVLVLPLIGAVNEQRARQVVETLVVAVQKNRARVAILDITGVPQGDVQIADALLRAARAARLVGAEVVLTGTRPEVAQSFVELGTSLEGIVTFGTLRRAVDYALHGRVIR